MAAPPRTHAPHVFVDDLERLDVSDDDLHHLAVLRIATGAEVVACDGRGSWRLTNKTRGGLDPARNIEALSLPAPPIEIAFGLTKGDKPETVAQKLTELGVDRIVPVACERSVARWDDEKAQKNLLRLSRVARQAAMQSRRITLPRVEPLRAFAELVSAEPWCLAQRDGVAIRWPAHTSIAIGPEGGFSEGELAVAAEHVCLGQYNLRAETAAVAAATLLGALRSGAG